MQTRIRVLLLSACLSGIATTVLAQTQAASTITKLTTIDVQQVGKAPTGPYRVVVEHDPKLATHTIYRPSELSMAKHPVLVWGEGGCAKNGLIFCRPAFRSSTAYIRRSAMAAPITRTTAGPSALSPSPG
jgi:hypothetical protein